MKVLNNIKLLEGTEKALTKLIVLCVHMKKRKNKTKFYRDILRRRMSLTNLSKQLRGFDEEKSRLN